MGIEMPVSNQENLTLEKLKSRMFDVLGENEEEIINQFDKASKG